MSVIVLIEPDAAERECFIHAAGPENRVIAVDGPDVPADHVAEADLVVVGLGPDGMDLTVLDRLFALRADLPIVITAPATLHGWQLLRSGMRLGAREFLTKPFDEQEVAQTIQVITNPARPEPSMSA
jgi:DNA-binding response OmpR family regulator